MKTLQYILFIEQLTGLIAKTTVEMSNVVKGAPAKSIEELLDDSDATLRAVIAKAQANQNEPI